ncbi:tachylectin-related carbohydrate-binding protein [Micromonospora yasonensis]|uniref:N,N-dimethylformamidase beta subunit family domain-containing protein n=1 Tax=Micromonospora yasonensis TaxID=1128667 RepID=UPI00222F540E|nr:N,N-dimethylformamidase beta subunit family domain-containing protein [Micromonospora yasonensis]MCW3840321.1 tachylectin-related carbohydrate-binding protein [Micromonospora yasonensis]
MTATAVPAVLATDTAPAAAATPSYDPEQRFIQLVGGGDGVLYAIQADGSLLWYRHWGWETGVSGWASGSGRKIGSGWNQFVTVLGSTDGSLYGVRADGTVLYHRYVCTNYTTGAGYWGTSRQVAMGLNKFPRVFGFDGAIYGVDADGDLYGYRYIPSTGRWTGGSRIGRDFKSYQLQADASGVIFAWRFGDIFWYRHLGSGLWAKGSGFRLGRGFTELGMNGLMFAGQGALYGVKPSDPTKPAVGSLTYYRLNNWATAGTDQKATWVNGGSGKGVGSGFTMQSRAALQGYAQTPSVTPGQPVRVAVSSTFPSFTASVVRVAPSTGGPVVVTDATSVTGKLQLLPTGYLQRGCGWSDSYQLTIPEDWPSGLYAVRLEGPHQLRRYVPFVVRPQQPTNDIAFLVPSNTYHAYNTWGGHNQYCGDLSGVRTLTLRRPSTEWSVEPTACLEHTMWSDVMLLRWMAKQNLAFDCYDDADLHASGSWLSSYKALVLGSHPEYWSEAMRQHLADYEAGGGRVIYAGGNGIYERVAFSDDGSAISFRTSAGKRDTFNSLGLPASQVLGVNYTSASWFTFAPYAVVRDHPLLAGTRLTVGSQFGTRGYNGGASGWEVDTLLGLPAEAAPEDVIARGQNVGGGASMVLVEKPNGGFVFSASSISFAGALDRDPDLSTVFRNVFDLALARGAVDRTRARMQRTSPVPDQPEPHVLE